jgi:hypothetical protein
MRCILITTSTWDDDRERVAVARPLADARPPSL